ncbi:unnamed protein product [Bursaphelenchus okinawaensis]|uniref:Uncharacterized protein n=1 Tax=Bursaphelenchus okinawaensis TaxID=465554 RepID=A0A811KN57_9BILA|nr:unnamed protein product [Bursaphelenchus okinawaensis]CAG9106510.1 unnamed protein product [Bursaphelenchus okinawaensis]
MVYRHNDSYNNYKKKQLVGTVAEIIKEEKAKHKEEIVEEDKEERKVKEEKPLKEEKKNVENGVREDNGNRHFTTVYTTKHTSKISHVKPFFKKPKGTENLRCDWVFDGKHASYLYNLTQNRLKYNNNNFKDLKMDCASIKDRTYFPSTPNSQEEANFPIAVTRTVYRNYYFLELILAATYQPQNYYCYSIDQSSDILFKTQLRSLANCFDNVHVMNIERDLDGEGHLQHLATQNCFGWLNNKRKEWKYVSILQNHDFPMKTNLEMVKIQKLLNGSNDVLILPSMKRINEKLDWTVGHLKLFKDKAKQSRLANVSLSWVKGLFQATISRRTMDYLLNEMDLSTLINQLDDRATYGVDEMLYATLLSMEVLDIPNYFTQNCIQKADYVTRQSIWEGSKHCRSKTWRHQICLYGIEDLVPNLNGQNSLYANKMMMGDFNGIVCWLELLFNRTKFLEN